MQLTCRPFSGPADIQPMIDLLLAVRPPDRVSHWPGVPELYEVLARPAVTANTRVWLGEDSRCAAWAFVDEFDNIHFEQQPAALDDGQLSDMFEWADGVVGARDSEDEPATLDASADERDSPRITLLLRHGFAAQPVRTLYYARPLDTPIGEPVLPPGFTIRPLATGEVEAAATMHRAAFGTAHMTTENRRAMMSGPEYDGEGDLFVIAPDGRLAAYTMVSISASESAVSGRTEGFTDPVATHPDFRRLGLAKAVLLAGCARLQGLGATSARLGTSSANIAMQAAAEAAGYRLDRAAQWFRREIAHGRS